MAERPDWRPGARPALVKALKDKDQKTFTFTLVALIGVASEAEISEFASQLLDEMDHDVQMWWLDDCNCDGHLN